MLKKCLVLEFIVVTVVKPILMVPNPKKLLTWHKETERNKKRRFTKKVEKPQYEEVFTSPRFAGFCHLYFKIATALGAFQELGGIYFEVMKDTMFEEGKVDDFDSDVDVPDPDVLYRIINTPIPKMPTLSMPKLSVPNFGLYWRRLKRRKGLLAATTIGLIATAAGVGQYLYTQYYNKE